MWHWGRLLEQDLEVTFEETWDQMGSIWGQVSQKYERIRIRMQHEGQFDETEMNRVKSTQLLMQSLVVDQESKTSEPEVHCSNSPVDTPQVQGSVTATLEKETQDLSDKAETSASVPEINLELHHKEPPEMTKRDEEVDIGCSTISGTQEEQPQVLEAVGNELTVDVEDQREETQAQTRKKERPQHPAVELGDHVVSITRITDGKWDFKKKTDLSFTAIYPLPSRISDMEISHFCAVQERYIRVWHGILPRYTREQLRLAFEEYVQTYGWEIAVAESGWGPLDQYTARHSSIEKEGLSRHYEARVQRDRRVVTRSPRPLAGCDLTGLVEPCGTLQRKCLFIHLCIEKDKKSSAPSSPRLKSLPKKPIETISSYRQ
jgi:hypothetical protein